MEFRLTYEGRLASAATASAQHKHDIRRVFHSQLKMFCGTHPFFKNQVAWNAGAHSSVPPELDGPHRPQKSLSREEELAAFFRRGEYRFVPLILGELRLLCHLDILFLRPGFPGEALNAGDIDNRIKGSGSVSK